MIRLEPWVPGDAQAAALVDLVQRAERKALAVLLPRLRGDSRADSLSSLLLSYPGIVRLLERYLSPSTVATVVGSVGERARAASDRHWSGQVSRAARREVLLDTRPSREVLQGWIATNTAKIQSLRNESIERIRADIETAILSEARPEELAAKWEREGLPTKNGTLRGRATVIARDQLGKLAGQIAEQQQRALGLTEYMWDDRPSIPRKRDPVHAGRRGARYKWDAAPPGGHPSHRPNCRCRAVAVVSDERLRELGRV